MYADQRAAVRKYADEKANAANQYANEQLAAARQHANEQYAIFRRNRVLKAGETMTGDLIKGGKRVTVLPTGASASNSDATSAMQVMKVVKVK